MKLPKKEIVSLLTKENILSKIDEYDILRAYYPAGRALVLNRRISSPFRKEDNPSFIIGTKYGNITYKDMGDSYFRGDIWHFVKQIEGLKDYNEVLKHIDNKFNLGLSNGTISTEKPAIINWKTPKLEIQKPIFIQASLKSRDEEGESYLREYGLTLKDMNIFKDTKVAFAKELFINKRRQSLSKFCLVYNLKNERGNWIKAYKPLAKKETKWRSNIPFTEMHGISEIVGCETVILTKSVKDAAVITKFLNLCTTVIQAEDISAVSEESLEILKSIPNLYVTLDSDSKGKKVSWELTTLLKCKHVNPPDKLLEQGITDFADMCKVLGPESVIEHFKNKKII